MIDISSFISVVLSPQTEEIISLFTKDKDKSENTSSKQVSKQSGNSSKKSTSIPKRSTTKNSTKKEKKKAEQAPKQKSTCEQNNIHVNNVLAKDIKATEKTAPYNLSNITNEELKKYILFSDVLGTPVCKRRQGY